MTSPPDLSGDEIKSCCARIYESDIVRLLLGDNYHPGGTELSLRLARLTSITATDEVLDIASGPGTTALLVARETGANITGIDLGENTVREANRRAGDAGLCSQVVFRVGDAEDLPVNNGSKDVVLSECAFCTFPDKHAAAQEMARVLRPGGRLGISDIVVDPDRLTERMRSLSGWIACVAAAKPLETYVDHLEAAGLAVMTTERHDYAVLEMIDMIDARLTALRMIEALPTEFDTDEAKLIIAEARAAAEAGTIGYAVIAAAK